MSKALLIVDVQNDFCPGGALPAPTGDKIIPVINNILDRFPVIIASRDWHPEDTIHFQKWPVHCVQNSKGAEFPATLNSSKFNLILDKGTASKDDGYSAFEATNKNLAEYLKNNKIDELYITGLVAEYCVKNTVLDALKYGFNVVVIKDAVEGIRKEDDDFEKAFKEMEQAGAKVIMSNEI